MELIVPLAEGISRAIDGDAAAEDRGCGDFHLLCLGRTAAGVSGDRC
jgi:hypothetical protein